MNFSEYGNRAGKLVVYFHGAPGATQECSLFDCYAKDNNLRIICFERYSIKNKSSNAESQLNSDEDYYQLLAKAIEKENSAETVDFIGFSIGAQLAFEVSQRMEKHVVDLHLVSPAAPLNEGDFLNHMAGKALFKIARLSPMLLTLIVNYLGLIAALFPAFLFKMLFSNTAGKDSALAKSDEFKKYIIPILVNCYGTNVKGFVRDIRLYVRWNFDFSNHCSRTFIWQGTDDNWTPPAMAVRLNELLPKQSKIELLEGCSHYSSLFEAAPRICAQLADE